MVENSALQYLRAAVRLSIYRHIQALGSHRLSFADWQESIDLGVLLPVARSELQSWAPAMADYNSGSSRQNLTSTNDLILVDAFGPPIEQCAHFALARDGRFDEIGKASWRERVGR